MASDRSPRAPGGGGSARYERRAAAEAFATGKTVFVGGGPAGGDPGSWERTAPRRWSTHPPDRRTDGRRAASGRTVEAQVFTSDQQRLLEAFADEAALAVDRDRLLRDAARPGAQETDRLKSALSAVSTTCDAPHRDLTAASSLLRRYRVGRGDAPRVSHSIKPDAAPLPLGQQPAGSLADRGWRAPARQGLVRCARDVESAIEAPPQSSPRTG
jgi:hypothetical protein